MSVKYVQTLIISKRMHRWCFKCQFRIRKATLLSFLFLYQYMHLCVCVFVVVCLILFKVLKIGNFPRQRWRWGRICHYVIQLANSPKTFGKLFSNLKNIVPVFVISFCSLSILMYNIAHELLVATVHTLTQSLTHSACHSPMETNLQGRTYFSSLMFRKTSSVSGKMCLPAISN